MRSKFLFVIASLSLFLFAPPTRAQESTYVGLDPGSLITSSEVIPANLGVVGVDYTSWLDLGDFITCYYSSPPCATADFNLDGDINYDDLGDFITFYYSSVSFEEWFSCEAAGPNEVLIAGDASSHSPPSVPNVLDEELTWPLCTFDIILPDYFSPGLFDETAIDENVTGLDEGCAEAYRQAYFKWTLHLTTQPDGDIYEIAGSANGCSLLIYDFDRTILLRQLESIAWTVKMRRLTDANYQAALQTYRSYIVNYNTPCQIDEEGRPPWWPFEP